MVEPEIEVRQVMGWNSECFRIEHNDGLPHTFLIFVPGNPGLIDWYIPFFRDIVMTLGNGFAACGVANAGHSIREDCLAPIDDDCHWVGWTIDGQVQHKCAYIDLLLKEESERRSCNVEDLPLRFIFVSHSIGVHFTQRVCILRPDILKRCALFLHLTPFHRMCAPWDKQVLLDFVASRPTETISVHKVIAHLLRRMPDSIVDFLMKGTVSDEDGRRVAVALVRQPEFVTNFFKLGLEEIRDVPETFDTSAMRLMGEQCHTAMLFAGNDHWSPKFHIDDLTELQAKRVIPDNLSVEYVPQVTHSFVSYPNHVPPVLEFCISNIRKHVLGLPRL